MSEGTWNENICQKEKGKQRKGDCCQNKHLDEKK